MLSTWLLLFFFFFNRIPLGFCMKYEDLNFFLLFQVIDQYSGEKFDQRWIIGGCLIPLILLSWVPNLKKLAPVSLLANAFMGIGLGITFYYLVWDLPDISERRQISPIQDFPKFFSITIFAMEAIGVVSFWPNFIMTFNFLLEILPTANAFFQTMLQPLCTCRAKYITLRFLNVGQPARGFHSWPR